MPRSRSPNRDKAFKIFKVHDGNITNRAIAEELGVPEKTISAWKTRDKWNAVLQKDDCSTANDKSVDSSSKKRGNPNPVHKFSHHNNPSLLHGLRSKYLHQEQVEIMEAMDGLSVADQIWLQVEIKFSALMRMQKIMWVADDQDHLSEITGVGESISYKVSFAYERYEAYIKAQTRAMAEYRNLVKQWLALAGKDDERHLKLDGMQVDIERKRLEVEKLRLTNKDLEKGGNEGEARVVIIDDIN